MKHESVDGLFVDRYALPLPPGEIRGLTLAFTVTCSLRCPYCVNNMAKADVQAIPTLIDEIGAEVYLDYLDRIIDWSVPIWVGLTGAGEPSESPHFVALARGLFERGALLHLGTNLHGIRNLEAFAAGIDLTGRTKADVSFHYGAYTLKQIDRFPELWARFVKAGLTPTTLITPMTPGVLEEMDDYLEMVGRLQEIHPTKVVPLELYHFLDGVEYPAGYTRKDRERLKEVQSSVGYNAFEHGTGGGETSTIRAEALPHLVNYLEIQGQSCLIGMFRAVVRLDGWVVRCQHKPQTKIGHLRDNPPVRLYDYFALPCPGQSAGCKAVCNRFCLQPNGVSLADYFRAWYTERGEHEIGELFS